MIVFLFTWLLILTALVVVGFLMVIGKFARVGRDQHEVDGWIIQHEEESSKFYEVFEHAITDIATLQTEVENLKIQAGATQETLVDQMANVTSQVSGLIETTAGLHSMIEKGYEDRPVTASLLAASPGRNNKGGRPRKGQ